MKGYWGDEARTREAIDPVRYISNHSSGKQGHAIASALAQLGADVQRVGIMDEGAGQRRQHGRADGIGGAARGGVALHRARVGRAGRRRRSHGWSARCPPRRWRGRLLHLLPPAHRQHAAQVPHVEHGHHLADVAGHAREIGKLGMAHRDPFADLFVQQQQAKGGRFSPVTAVLRPTWRFFRAYVLRLGFLDGFPGLYIAWATAFGAFVRYSRLYEAEQRKEPPRG